jgi:hypothetical protein
MHPSWIEQLQDVVRKYVSRSGGEVDLKRWVGAVDLTSHRVGFLLCNDIEVAARMISTEPTPVGGMAAKDKIKELVLYSISEECFAARQHLGITIG